MDSSTFHLNWGATPTSRTRHPFQAVDLNDAKEKAREYLRTIVLPTDRPELSLSWAFIELPEGKRLWLVQEDEGDKMEEK